MKRDGFLDLNEALQHPGRTVAVDLSTDLPDVEDVELVTPIDGYLEAVSTGNMLLLEGEFKARCGMQCARCGGPLEQDIKFEVKEEFAVEGVPSSYSADDYARVVDDEGIKLFEGNNLMVEALLRQAVILAQPVQPLCAFGWEGDCPEAARLGASRPPHPLSKLEGLSQFLSHEEKEIGT